MNSITADKGTNRAARNLEAQRLSKLTGRAIDWRTIDCRCDENPFCDKCSGLGAYHEAFYLSCNHSVIDGVDLECEAGRCAEREARKAKKTKSTTMTTKEYERDGLSVTEKFYSYQECEQVYGSSNIGVLNRKFEADAKRATDGSCDMYAMYGNGGITIVVEC